MLKASQKDRLLVDHHQTLHVVEAARDLPADCLDSRALQPLLLVFRLDRMPELAGDRLDQELADQGRLADPEMPVTLVMTPSGMSISSRFRLLRVTPRRRSQPFGALLLESYGGRQSLHVVYLGHGHLVEQPPRIGRDRFKVATLRLGVERAEGERGFARS
jgi:hypothetical protein